MAINDPKVKSTVANPLQPVREGIPTQAPATSPAARSDRASSAQDAQRLGKIAGSQAGGARGLWAARNAGPIQIGTMTFPSANEAISRVLEYEPALNTLEEALS